VIFSAIKEDDVDIMFASLEVMKGHILDMLRDISSQICLLVSDECHCISEW
jgi:superfamily II DNA helicase RecQ